MAIHPSGSNQASPALVRQQVQAQLDAATPADLRYVLLLLMMRHQARG